MPAHHSAYRDDDSYGRDTTRGTRRDREGRDTRDTRDRELVREVPREPPRERRAPDMEPPQRLQPRMLVDSDMMDSRQQARVANAGVPRQDPRAVRPAAREPRDPRDRGDDDMMYDVRPGDLRQNRLAAVQDPTGARRTPYEGEFDDMPAAVRPVIDPGRSRDEPRPSYNEYFLPGDGIDREVIQSEICRYLGQDATCKPGTHNDGRRGYIIRAYRALTTEMIRSLKEDSAKYGREKETATSRNRQPASFAAFRDQSRYGGGDVDMLDESEDPRYPPRYEQPRLRGPAVSSGYPPDAAYATAYYPATQPPPPGVDTRTAMDPRYIPGNTTPPTNRVPGYAPSGYSSVPSSRTSAPPISAAGAFLDPRGNIVRDPGYGAYQPDPRARHR